MTLIGTQKKAIVPKLFSNPCKTMRLLSWLITLPLLAVILVFVVGNRDMVSLSLWPLDAVATMPLALLAMGLLFLGILLGAFITWVSTLHHRFEASRLRRELKWLNEKMSVLQTKSQISLPPAAGSALSRLRSFTSKLHWPGAHS